MATRMQHSDARSKQRRKDVHLKSLQDLDLLTLSDSCCDLCRCDCFNSNRSSNLSVEGKSLAREGYNYDCCVQLAPISKDIRSRRRTFKNAERKVKRKKSASSTIERLSKPKYQASKSARTSPVSRFSSCNSPTQTQVRPAQRSKSASSLRSRSPGAACLPDSKYYTRDCKILQDLFSSFEDTKACEGKKKHITKMQREKITRNAATSTRSASIPPWPSLHVPLKAVPKPKEPPAFELCPPMANLCLAPIVREAFRQVPTHDKRILNRMATKRSEQVVAKESAWLAQKYWENERYERELLKCEQMEEYKRAIRDKQFQDYLITRARLNELAQRDYAELQRLRDEVQAKDERARRRLERLRIERDILLCQRRCDELRKSEAVNVHQEEVDIHAALRKEEIYQCLSDRLQRAEQIRVQGIQGYLRRLRYDNTVEQLLHEEHWRETKEQEIAKRQLLQDHISRKRSRSQKFAAQRQKQNEAVKQTAAISASLRELVKSSLTPDGAVMDGAASIGAAAYSLQVPISLNRLLIDKPISKISL